MLWSNYTLLIDLFHSPQVSVLETAIIKWIHTIYNQLHKQSKALALNTAILLQRDRTALAL